jgi:hypothetical protein
MKYEKPEVTCVSSALHVIQGQTQKGNSSTDMSDGHATPNAYEADE